MKLEDFLLKEVYIYFKTSSGGGFVRGILIKEENYWKIKGNRSYLRFSEDTPYTYDKGFMDSLGCQKFDIGEI